MSLAACTIVSKNFLPFARVLARSFDDLHPDARFEPTGKLHRDAITQLRQGESAARTTVVSPERIPTRFYKKVTPKDRPADPAQIIQLRAVRLVVWRLRFDPSTAQMSWQALGEPVEVGNWP